MKRTLLSIVMVYANFVVCENVWIDPFNMNTEAEKHSQEQCACNLPAIANNAFSHYKRTINLLLASVVVDQTDSVNYKGHLFINIPTESYDFLKRFTKDMQEDPVILQKVDHILTNIFTKSTMENLADVVLSWRDYINYMFYNRTTGIFMSSLLITFICYKLLRANWTLWLITKYLVFVSWIIDFAFTWIHLLQEGEINKIADSLRYESVPPHCNPKGMSFFQYFWSALSTEDECRNYHRVFLKDIFWSVGPFTVFAHQAGRIILTPSSYIGNAISDFTRGILSGLIWPLNMLLLPMLLLFTLVILCIILSFLTKTTFNVNILHLLQFSFGDHDRKHLANVVTGDNLKKLLDGASHRNMIEDVKNTGFSGKPLKPSKSTSSMDKDEREVKQKLRKVKSTKSQVKQEKKNSSELVPKDCKPINNSQGEF